MAFISWQIRQLPGYLNDFNSSRHLQSATFSCSFLFQQRYAGPQTILPRSLHNHLGRLTTEGPAQASVALERSCGSRRGCGTRFAWASARGFIRTWSGGTDFWALTGEAAGKLCGEGRHAAGPAG